MCPSLHAKHSVMREFREQKSSNLMSKADPAKGQRLKWQSCLEQILLLQKDLRLPISFPAAEWQRIGGHKDSILGRLEVSKKSASLTHSHAFTFLCSSSPAYQALGSLTTVSGNRVIVVLRGRVQVGQGSMRQRSTGGRVTGECS